MIAFVMPWISSGITLLRGSMMARIVAVSLAAMIALQVYGAYERSRGAAKVIEQSKAAGDRINKKNKKIRQASSKPGAPERVLKKYCRDCD